MTELWFYTKNNHFHKTKQFTIFSKTKAFLKSFFCAIVFKIKNKMKNKFIIFSFSVLFLITFWSFFQLHNILSQENKLLVEKIEWLTIKVKNLKNEEKETRFIEESNLISAVEITKTAVVSIISKKHLQQLNFFWNPLPQKWNTAKKVKTWWWSGFIYSKKDGLVMTNKHVLLDTKASYFVVLSNWKEIEAKIIAKDIYNDIAILKVNFWKEIDNISDLKFGNSKDLKVWQKVVAIWNALAEFQNSVTTWIISAFWRHIYASNWQWDWANLYNLLQTDAAINLWNSWWPLVNLKWQLIWMNTAISGKWQWIWFAIPVNLLKNAANSVKRYWKIRYPYAWIKFIMLNQMSANKFWLKVKEGAFLAWNKVNNPILKWWPADVAWLQTLDIIISINSEQVNSKTSLPLVLQKFDIWEKVKMWILRWDKKIFLDLVLWERK